MPGTRRAGLSCALALSAALTACSKPETVIRYRDVPCPPEKVEIPEHAEVPPPSGTHRKQGRVAASEGAWYAYGMAWLDGWKECSGLSGGTRGNDGPEAE